MGAEKQADESAPLLDERAACEGAPASTTQALYGAHDEAQEQQALLGLEDNDGKASGGKNRSISKAVDSEDDIDSASHDPSARTRRAAANAAVEEPEGRAEDDESVEELSTQC